MKVKNLQKTVIAPNLIIKLAVVVILGLFIALIVIFLLDDRGQKPDAQDCIFAQEELELCR